MNSLFIYSASLKNVLEELALSSRSFAFTFDDVILYPLLLGGKMRSVYSEIFQLAWNVFLDLRINTF